jgi:hypothetical protein
VGARLLPGTGGVVSAGRSVLVQSRADRGTVVAFESNLETRAGTLFVSVNEPAVGGGEDYHQAGTYLTPAEAIELGVGLIREAGRLQSIGGE